MTATSRTLVVVDTGVFGARLTPPGEPLAFAYREHLAGKKPVISFVTDTELRFGAAVANWGARRIRRLEAELATAHTVWPDEALAAKYVDLRTACVRAGHGLGHKEHEADRWVAATAMWLGIPLVTHDRIFLDVAGLDVLTELDH